MDVNSYNPFYINTQPDGPGISYNQYGAPSYYSSAPSQPGAYGPNQLGVGYIAPTQPAAPSSPNTTIPQSPKVDYKQYGQAALGGLGAGFSTPLVADDYSIDPFAGYKGSGQGYMQGGALGAIVGGITAQVRNFSRVNRNLRNLNTNIDGVAIGADGRPVYQGQNVLAGLETNKALAEGINSVNDNKIKSFADPINPFLATLFGTRRKLKTAKRKVQSGLNAAATSYNAAAEDYARKRQADNAFRNSQFELFNNSLSLPQSYSSLF